MLAAYRFGPGPGTFAAVLSVACFDFFYVPPRFSFAVSDIHYTVTFVVMLGVALLVGQITARLRFQATVAADREHRMRALFEMARDLSSALTLEQTADLSQHFVTRVFDVPALLLVLNDKEQIESTPDSEVPPEVDLSIAQWAADHTNSAGLTTDTLASSPALYLPLKAPMRTRGVLAVQPLQPRLLLVPEQRQQPETFAVLSAIALERVHYVEVAQQATVQIESERLRNSLLSALSHDLRTPLAALYGLADTLVSASSGLPAAPREIAQALSIEARRMNALVDNLLDMARLQSGAVHLNRQWQPLEEVAGSALSASASALAAHRVHTALPADLPLVSFDAVLIERVLCNLLENAAKYTPAGSLITLSARLRDADLVVSVSDEGPGLPAGREEALFEKFVRGQRESATPGVGLGLAICRAIVEAHAGRIWTEPGDGAPPMRGARFCFTLPLGTPPAMPLAEEADAAMISP